MLVDEGVCSARPALDERRAASARSQAPPTIQALLAARLDRLERERARRARARGGDRQESSGARRCAGAARPRRARVDELLDALVRKELVLRRSARRRGRVPLPAHPRSATPPTRALPRSAAPSCTSASPTGSADARRDRLREYEEILGYHLEQAHRYLAELAPATTRGPTTLAARAAALLASAGRRAFARDDMPAAVGLLRRATLLLRDDEPARLKLAPDLATSIAHVGELARAEGLLDRAIEAAHALGDEQLELHALLLSARSGSGSIQPVRPTS